MSRAPRKDDPRHAPNARAPRTPFVLLVLGLLGGGLCALLALNTAAAANDLSRDNLAGRDQGIAGQVADLRNEVAASAAPANLAEAAGRLGMVHAAAPAFLVIGADGKVQLRGSPSAVVGVPIYVAPSPSKTAKKSPKHSQKSPGHSQKSPKKSPKSPGNSPQKSPGKSPRTSPKNAPSTSPPTSPKDTPTTPTPTPTPNTTLPGGTR